MAFLDYSGLQHYDEKLKGQFVAKEEGKQLSTNDFTDAYKQMIDDLAYEPMTISSFTNNVNTVEMGSTVADVTLSWALNKEPKSQTLDGATLDKALRTKALTGQSITANKTWTLGATDERDKTVTKTTGVTFLNGVYWGVAADAQTFDSAFILKLSKGLQGSKAKTFTVTAGAGQHIYYALPARYGTPGFNVGGFDGGFGKAATIDFTNASGYKESYDIYKSDNAGLGGTTVKVS